MNILRRIYVSAICLISIVCAADIANATREGATTCKSVDSVGGDTQAPPQTWQELYRSYLRFRNCHDGALGEAYSEFVVYLLTEKWDQMGNLVALDKRNPSYGRFVLKHVDELMSPDQARHIESNAKTIVLIMRLHSALV